ncbi:MAG TPA: hypothetical protein VHS03_03290 [Gaiellaceae bacterium]|jgi:hypothetical protein|nr:hypothetical protein [Gaiellaceae bacterium]
MRHRRPEAGDHENTGFHPVEPDAHHVKPGFDAGDEAEEGDGAVRYPHRRSESDVPKSLAEQLHGKKQGGA